MNGQAWLIVLGLIAGYAGVCWFWPITKCGKCKGTGKCFAPGSRRSHRTCPRCDGKGVHMRMLSSILHSGDDD